MMTKLNLTGKNVNWVANYFLKFEKIIIFGQCVCKYQDIKLTIFAEYFTDYKKKKKKKIRNFKNNPIIKNISFLDCTH